MPVPSYPRNPSPTAHWLPREAAKPLSRYGRYRLSSTPHPVASVSQLSSRHRTLAWGTGRREVGYPMVSLFKKASWSRWALCSDAVVSGSAARFSVPWIQDFVWLLSRLKIIPSSSCDCFRSAPGELSKVFFLFSSFLSFCFGFVFVFILPWSEVKIARESTCDLFTHSTISFRVPSVYTPNLFFHCARLCKRDKNVLRKAFVLWDLITEGMGAWWRKC